MLYATYFRPIRGSIGLTLNTAAYAVRVNYKQ